MKKIKAIGGYLPINKNGYLVNDTSFQNINSELINLLSEVIFLYNFHEKESLHSIWLRGSVARGNYVPNVSDLDFFALVYKKNIRWKTASWAQKNIPILQNRYSFSGDIELNISSWYPNFYNKNLKLSFYLKTQSLFLFGHNIQKEIPSFTINKDLQINLAWLEEDVAEFLRNKSPNKKEIQMILKVIIRSAFEAIMIEEGKYTVDLYWCYYSFSKQRPTKKKIMLYFLESFVNPEVIDLEELKRQIIDFKTWLLD